MSIKTNRQIFFILQLATVAVFLGRAWQHLIWDAPYRTLLWDEAWMSGIIPWLFDMPYEDFVTSIKMDDTIQMMIKGVGWFYFLCGLVAIFIKKIPRIVTYLLWVGTASLIFLAFLYCKEKFFQVGQFSEYTLQFSTPIFLYFLWKKQKTSEHFILAMKIAIAITFVSHGLYALNYYPRPGHFTQMVIDILGVSEASAEQFLTTVGIMDFMIAVGIFLPKNFGKAMLWVAVIWGFATTMARIFGHFYLDMIEDTLTMWVHEAMYRAPHFLIPLAVIFTARTEKTLAH